ncbi:hypothetical protein QG37_06428 [Candidozyma auris]|uniref:Uncharacterized protein n=1 Tax=Candidozyma auris TaxID=498019 RepID=A0A0L0NT49_CANAR|nr:hypothetical protein QG37_06428 [[Candida] auris]
MMRSKAQIVPTVVEVSFTGVIIIQCNNNSEKKNIIVDLAERVVK